MAASPPAPCVTLGNGPASVPGALMAVSGGGLMVGAALMAGRSAAVLQSAPVAVGLMLYGLAGVILVTRVGRFHTAPRFGLANVLTLTRLVATCILAAFAVELGRGGAANNFVMWILFALAAAALIVDGLDGFAARRLGLASAFGARFDMEVDALLILVLSAVAFAVGKAGLWVIAGGLLRYIYVLAAMMLPALARPLAPAWRRKAIAVIQGATLTALLAPVIQPPVSTLTALIALVLLIYSFGLDIVAQVRAS